MKLLLLTYGTEGDTRPLAALARALMDAGHTVELLADGGTLGSARALGVPAQALSGDIRAAMNASRSARETGAALTRLVHQHTDAWMRQALDAARGCDTIVVSGLTAFVGLSVAEKLGIPPIGTGLFPITPSADFASPFLPPARVPRFLRHASHRVVNAMLWRVLRGSTNAARAAVCGLPPRRQVWTEHPMLYGISPSLVPQPADWPAQARICGQWLAPHTGDWQPPPALSDFLAAGEAPVYIGFGSMTGIEPARLLREVRGAIGERRALIYPGWSGIDTAALPPNFHVLSDTPHDWLFPRTALVVHHGGSGTTHTAARAGVPSVVTPFAGDQAFWADRLQRLGVAGEAVPAARLDARRLARAIDFAAQPAVRQRAAALGERMRAEDGLGVALRTITRLLSRAKT